MTFNEAIEQIDALTMYGTVGLSPEVAQTIVEMLRGTYAPTIEMTKEQAHVLNEYREPGLYDGDYAFSAFFDDTYSPRLNSMGDSNFYDNLTEKQLMKAWLHPESIKVINEDKA